MAIPATHPLQHHDLPLGYPSDSSPKALARLTTNTTYTDKAVPLLSTSATPFAQKSRSPQHQPIAMCIALGTLKNFEIVTDQYQRDGILFENAIAIHPSNPAFPTRPAQILLVGGPKAGVIDILFREPVYEVEGYVTSSTATVLPSFGAHGEVISRSETLGNNLSGRKHTHHSANTRLAIGETPMAAMNCREVSIPWPQPSIHRVQFRSPGGQFTITDINVVK